MTVLQLSHGDQRTRWFTANAVTLFCVKTHNKTVIGKYATIGQCIKR